MSGSSSSPLEPPSAAAPVPRRPVLAGNGVAAQHVLDLLLEGWSPEAVLVVAPPETQRHAWQPSLAEHAAARQLAVLQPRRVNDDEVIGRIRDHGADLLLSVYYTQIFRPELLAAIDGPALNFHPALLPRHRGTAPLIWALVEGDRMTGVSVHRLTEGVDTGPLVQQQVLPIHRDDTGFTLHMKAARLVRSGAAALIRRLLRGEGLPRSVEQTGPASLHRKSDPRVNHVDWHDSRERVHNVVRALAPPLPGAHTFFRDRQIVLERVEPHLGRAGSRPVGMLTFDRGTGSALAWASDGPLELVRVRSEGSSGGGGDLLAKLGAAEGDMLR